MAAPWEDLGDATVTFGGTDLGENNIVAVRASDDVAVKRTASTGITPRGGVYTGTSFEVDVEMKESTLTQIGLVLPNAATSGTATRVSTSAGIDTSTMEGILIIKPSGSATTSKHITILRAVPQIDWEFEFTGEGPDGGRMYKVTFVAHVVTTAGSPSGTAAGELFLIGADT